ncbi:hypothetical protein F2P81_024537 [Scophthalmus maximus]|uniref:Uncharacterized protein n=1 Tax=Scophthalmus maximus TaxID=52904 RepID=A0A6A4RUA4_SCOMX|nr:hypothetical protein F2P81_024537 [Scophthalmus maximus]
MLEGFDERSYASARRWKPGDDPYALPMWRRDDQPTSELINNSLDRITVVIRRMVAFAVIQEKIMTGTDNFNEINFNLMDSIESRRRCSFVHTAHELSGSRNPRR